MKKRKILAGIMAAAIILSSLVITAFAGELKNEFGTFYFKTNSDGTATLSRYVKPKQEGSVNVVVPSEYDGRTVTVIGSNAFYSANVDSIELPETVTAIEAYGLAYCKAAVITLNEGLISLGEGAFANCTNLNDTVLPESLEIISDKAFIGCSSLKSLYVGKGTDVIGEDAFYGCTKLEKVEIAGELSVIERRAFSGCSALNEVIFSGKVNTIEYGAFADCTALESIVLPEGLEELGAWVFSDCDELSEISLPDSLKKIGVAAFRGLPIKVMELPDGLTYLGGAAFYYCEELKTITVPAGITTLCSGLFEGCAALEEFIIEADEIVYIGDDVFKGTPYYNDEANWENGLLYFRDCLVDCNTKLGKEYTIKDGTSLIAGEALNDTELEVLIIPESVKYISGDVAVENSSLRLVKYLGTKAEWRKVDVYEYNEEFFEAKVVCMEDHVHTEEWFIVKEATETRPGFKYSVCTECEEKVQEKNYYLSYFVNVGNGLKVRYKVGERVIFVQPETTVDEVTGKTYIFMGWNAEGVEINTENNVASFIMPENDVTLVPILQLQGDINGDGKLTSADLLALTVSIKNGETDSICDVNMDGKITSLDKLTLSLMLKS